MLTSTDSANDPQTHEPRRIHPLWYVVIVVALLALVWAAGFVFRGSHKTNHLTYKDLCVGRGVCAVNAKGNLNGLYPPGFISTEQSDEGGFTYTVTVGNNPVENTGQTWNFTEGDFHLAKGVSSSSRSIPSEDFLVDASGGCK